MFATIKRPGPLALSLVLLASVFVAQAIPGETGAPPQGELDLIHPLTPAECPKTGKPADLPGNLVANGSFERRAAGEPPANIATLKAGSKEISGWEIIDPLGGADVVETELKEDRSVHGWGVDWIGPERWQASHGRHCLDLDAGVRQSIQTEPKREYEVCFAAAANPEQGPFVVHLRVLIDDETHEFTLDSAGKTTGDLGWVMERIKFTAQRKETTLTFLNSRPNGHSVGVALDHIVVTDADRAADRGAAKDSRYRISESSSEPILLDTVTGQTWRLTTQDGQQVWLAIPRERQPAQPDAGHRR